MEAHLPLHLNFRAVPCHLTDHHQNQLAPRPKCQTLWKHVLMHLPANLRLVSPHRDLLYTVLNKMCSQTRARQPSLLASSWAPLQNPASLCPSKLKQILGPQQGKLVEKPHDHHHSLQHPRKTAMKLFKAHRTLSLQPPRVLN